MRKPKMRDLLWSLNRVNPRGTVIKVVYGKRYAGIDQTRSGMAIRQMQYGMDAVPFRLIDNSTVRFLGKDRFIINTLAIKETK